jgi:Rieske Fe-S protein
MTQEKNPQQNNPNDSMPRRLFLRLSLMISGLISTWGVFRFLNYEPPGEVLLSSITLSEIFAYRIGSATYVPQVLAWLFHDSEGFYAISATCPHLGCTVAFKGEGFNCPCHDSQFDARGHVTQGPAIKSLPYYQVRFSEDNRVMIDRTVTVPFNQRVYPST